MRAESKEPQSGELHHSSSQLTTRNKSTSKFEVLKTAGSDAQMLAIIKDRRNKAEDKDM